MKPDVQQQIADIKRIRDRGYQQDRNGELREPPQPNKLNLEIFSAAELMQKQLPPLKWIVPNYLPEGCTILAGKPKIGKSWLVLNMVIAISQGTSVLGETCCKRDVLYCALEDGHLRLQTRIRDLLGTTAPNFNYALTMPALEKGGREWLLQYIAEHRSVSAIFVDTIAKLRGIRTPGEDPQAYDYRLIGMLHDIHKQTGVSFTAVTHTRKQEAMDVFDTVSGTTGTTAAADTIAVLTRIQDGTRLCVRGRDVEEIDKVASFDLATKRWVILHDYEADELAADTKRRILATLHETKYPMSPKDIADRLQLPVNTVNVQLFRMRKNGVVNQATHGKYTAI